MLALLRVLLRVRGGAQGNQHEQRPHQRVGKSIEVLGSEHAETDVRARARVPEGGVSPQHFQETLASITVYSCCVLGFEGLLSWEVPRARWRKRQERRS